MAERRSKTQRLKARSISEAAIMEWRNDPFAWCVNVCGIKLDSLQRIRWEALDTHPETVCWDARRMRKTTTHYLHALHDLATTPFGEFCAITPRKEQALKSIDEYMLTQIRREDLPLWDFLEYRAGRRRINDSGFTLANRSKAWVAGIMSQIDGSGLTYALMDEIEDLDYDRLVNRFLPMLAQTQKLGSPDKRPAQIRALGVLKGSGIRRMFQDKGFFPMTRPDPHGMVLGDIMVGIGMKIVNPKTIDTMRELMAPDEFQRQFRCQDIEADTVIRLQWVRRAMKLAASVAREGRPDDLGTIAAPMPGREHRRRGLISFGYDHLGHGENPQGSRSSLVVSELVGEHIVFPFVHSWPPFEDETRILEDLLFFWRYFRPDYAMGDALGIGMLTTLNDRLFQMGMTGIDRQTIGDGRSSQGAWRDWAFSPIRFTGENKHQMASSLRMCFQRHRAVIPWFNDDIPMPAGAQTGTPEQEFKRFIQQLTNVVADPNTHKAYPSYKMDNRDAGDDYFDAAMGSVWGLTTRGAAVYPPTEIVTAMLTNEAILESDFSHLLEHPNRIPGEHHA